MFIKIETPEDKIGKKFITNRPLSCLKGTLLQGSWVTVIGISERGYDLEDIQSGQQIFECGFDCVG